MSRYRDYWFWQAVLSGGDVTVSIEIAKVFADIDARLSKLEADAAKPKAEPKTIIATSEVGDHLTGADATRDAAKPRELGWYWAKWRAASEWEAVHTSHVQFPYYAFIGPRIQEPSE